MTVILQNHQQHSRPTRQLCKAKSYWLDIEDLLDDGELDTSMAKWCQHRLDDGATLFLWSEREKVTHAQKRGG